MKCIKTGAQLYDRERQEYHHGDLHECDDGDWVFRSVNQRLVPIAPEVHAIANRCEHIFTDDYGLSYILTLLIPVHMQHAFIYEGISDAVAD